MKGSIMWFGKHAVQVKLVKDQTQLVEERIDPELIGELITDQIVNVTVACVLVIAAKCFFNTAEEVVLFAIREYKWAQIKQ